MKRVKRRPPIFVRRLMSWKRLLYFCLCEKCRLWISRMSMICFLKSSVCLFSRTQCQKTSLSRLWQIYASIRNLLEALTRLCWCANVLKSLLKTPSTFISCIRTWYRRVVIDVKEPQQIPAVYEKGPWQNTCYNIKLHLLNGWRLLVNYQCKAKKSVAALSKMHCSPKIDADSRKKRPEIINDYNKTKSGEDVLDQMSDCIRQRQLPDDGRFVSVYDILNQAAINTHTRVQWSNRADLKEEIYYGLGTSVEWSSEQRKEAEIWSNGRRREMQDKTHHILFYFLRKKNILHVRFMSENFLKGQADSLSGAMLQLFRV